MARLMRACCLGVATLALAWAGSVWAGETVENYPNGLVKIRYTLDKDGHKSGAYWENYETGKPKIRANYKSDKLDGSYGTFYESGKPHLKAGYADGRRQGEYQEWDEAGKLVCDQVYWNDVVLVPRSLKAIKTALSAIGDEFARASAPSILGQAINRKGDLTGVEDATANQQSIRRLNAYRYLAGVPCDVTLNAEYNEFMKAAAEICSKLGHITHTPENPGLPEADFKKAYFGTSHANLSQGRGTRESVDGYMYDSDSSNIAIVGHRRWCLNPAMAQTGFGQKGKFSAMYSQDTARKTTPDFDLVAFPPAGWAPVAYFGPEHAWSLTLNPKKYAQPDKAAVKVKLYPLAPAAKGQIADPRKREAAAELDFFNVSLDGAGISNCIIFRPAKVSVKDGAAYWVEITGVKKTDGSEAKIEYLVQFVQL